MFSEFFDRDMDRFCQTCEEVSGLFQVRFDTFDLKTLETEAYAAVFCSEAANSICRFVRLNPAIFYDLFGVEHTIDSKGGISESWTVGQDEVRLLVGRVFLAECMLGLVDDKVFAGSKLTERQSEIAAELMFAGVPGYLLVNNLSDRIVEFDRLDYFLNYIGSLLHVPRQEIDNTINDAKAADSGEFVFSRYERAIVGAFDNLFPIPGGWLERGFTSETGIKIKEQWKSHILMIGPESREAASRDEVNHIRILKPYKPRWLSLWEGLHTYHLNALCKASFKNERLNEFASECFERCKSLLGRIRSSNNLHPVVLHEVQGIHDDDVWELLQKIWKDNATRLKFNAGSSANHLDAERLEQFEMSYFEELPCFEYVATTSNESIIDCLERILNPIPGKLHVQWENWIKDDSINELDVYATNDANCGTCCIYILLIPMAFIVWWFLFR